ncbi:60S ribosomal protein L22-1 [Tritrichomonas foetus]|uniref:Large ribosomal subunit protein eL22 n=1 Tax=Tritrichomonas foetus TaxID=1144522 RepID=A0A1J4KM83_9EUKA|nr:60S ribosomal protein L22-1 [Tritrichomonas foetus]OHT12423.1 60S ribosomal protein L22-1 [Tritrichomonas foetus]|eukprot:OHS97187.1 60S ribosomal protein L22-1 [Tritrichomonas foetus]
MSATFHVDCAAPVSDNLLTLADFVEYLNKKMKVNKLRNNLNGKVTIEADAGANRVTVTASVKYSKRAVRYYARKFLQKQGLHQRFRVVATSTDSYEFRQYGPTSKE